MAIANHLTVRDYFDRALVGRSINRRANIAQAAGKTGSRTFQKLIASFGERPSPDQGTRPNGLTVVDYLSNPVQAKYIFSDTVKSEPAQNKEAVSARFHGPEAMRTAGNVTDKTAEKKSLKQVTRTAGISSTPPPPQSEMNKTGIIEKNIHMAADKYDLPVALLKGVIRAESNFQPRAVSRAGARGLMQLMPATARELGVENPFDIEQNIDGGARYLRKMLDRFGGDVKLALAAYNAGPGTVERYGGKIPPYQETESYIDRVLRFTKQMV